VSSDSFFDPVITEVSLRSGSSGTRMETAFTEALRDVVVRVPGARGAVFLDCEGEAVDEFAQMPTTEIRILGAHLGILLALVREHAPFVGEPLELCIEAERAIMLVLSIDKRYLVVLEAAPDAPLGLMRRELAKAVESLREQM
jgi:predicted regulator of Ras-like GTPase activity (Roadblock/LC7/MglB family)